MNQARNTGLLAGLFIAGFLLRLAAIYFLPTADVAGIDSQMYEGMARNLVQSGQLLSPFGYAIKPPLFPLLLAGIYKIFGMNEFYIYVFQAILSSLVTLVLYLFAERIIGKKGAFIAAAIYVIHPAQFFFMRLVLSEPLFTLLIISCSYATYQLSVQRTVGKTVLLSVLSGCLVLTRQEAAVYVLFNFGYLFFFRRAANGLSFIKHTGLFFVCLILVVAPYVIRNKITLGHYTLGSNLGSVFYTDNHPGNHGGYNQEFENKAEKLCTGHGLSMKEYECNQFLLRESMAHFQNKQEILSLILKKIKNLFAPSGNKIADALAYALIPFSLLGFVFAARNPKKEHLLIYGIVIGRLFITVIFHGEWRYLVPILPYFFIFSGLGMVLILNRFGPASAVSVTQAGK